jgi:hypothetical protein
MRWADGSSESELEPVDPAALARCEPPKTRRAKGLRLYFHPQYALHLTTNLSFLIRLSEPSLLEAAPSSGTDLQQPLVDAAACIPLTLATCLGSRQVCSAANPASSHSLFSWVQWQGLLHCSTLFTVGADLYHANNIVAGKPIESHHTNTAK